MNAVRISADDNVAVAVCDIPAGAAVEAGGARVTALEPVAQGHKLALRGIEKGEDVIKYGCPIGRATRDIRAGEWVHTHNCATKLDGAAPAAIAFGAGKRLPPPAARRTFMGFRRADGRAAVRNEVWIVPTVGCVNDVARRLAADAQPLVGGSLGGVYAFCHPYGCSQLGDDLSDTQKILAALVRHPNAAGVLVVGLGCENNTMDSFKAVVGPTDARRVRFLVCQQEADELSAGAAQLRELTAYAKTFEREPIDCGELIVGLKCGGSDGLSGITANPAVGAVSDRLIAAGGSAILTEVPEMFGAEQLLFSRCADAEVYRKATDVIERFKRYFVSHGQTVYENPSPGNKQGGITTLEDKSLGCVQKGGTSPVRGVIGYAEQAAVRGLNILYGPGNDLVSSTALAAAGAHMILFTTGRGTPFGTFVPTLKIASNSELFRKKNNWCDYDAGGIAAGRTIEDTADGLFELILETAGGQLSKSERNGCREIAIFKNGVTL
ncbi:MAG: altronate dehydratase family protein [Oscillospiraceae bacterium]|nr:altronate dehydratase family protein [Oscillospiraceae bacterium]